MKKLIFLLLFATFSFTFYAKTATYESDEFKITFDYNEQITPGDAIFGRLNFTFNKNFKKNKNQVQKEINASMQILNDKKVIEASPFYSISNSKIKNKNKEFLCGLPLSTLLENGNYSLKVIFSLPDGKIHYFALPLQFTPKSFNEKIIDFNENNKKITMENSVKKMKQREKLSEIFSTVIYSDIFHLTNFSLPIQINQKKASFGDKQIIQYSNGKKMTNIHFGIDYEILNKTEIKACADGKIILAENMISTGFSVVIEHLPGLYSVYYNLSEINIKEGEQIKLGEQIGFSNDTEFSNESNFHWEIRLNNLAINPEFFLNDFTFENIKND